MDPDTPWPWDYMRERFRTDVDTLVKSITVKRKRHMFLNGDRGIKVWPECVEKVFVQGLCKYRESLVHATSPSRNYFLVDYLKINGIHRTRKQVSSHIQVLRKMWKGGPEFYLVARTEELDSKQTHIEAEPEDQPSDQIFVRYPDFDDADFSWIGASSSSNIPPTEATRKVPSPGMSLYPFLPDIQATLDNHSANGITVPSGLSSIISSTAQNSCPTLTIIEASQCMTNYECINLPDSVSADRSLQLQGVTPSQTAIYSQNQFPELKALSFIAEGANPSWVRLDALTSRAKFAPLTPLTLNISLNMGYLVSSTAPSIAASFLSPIPTCSIKCSTTVFINGRIETEEATPLNLAALGDGYMTALLPILLLRWLEHSLPVAITQEITADNETLVYIIYELDKTANWASAKLLNFSMFYANDKTAIALALP